jgi:cobalt-zinc-cadmium efflux system protein
MRLRFDLTTQGETEIMGTAEQHDHSRAPAGNRGGHGHGGHDHNHAPASFGKAFAIGTALNFGFVVAEVFYGIAAGSVALLADAGHNFSDVLGLIIAWGATKLAKRKPGGRYTYGLRSSSIIAAFLNAMLLLVATTIIAVETVRRFGHPQMVQGTTVMWVAGAGVLVNGITALLFMSGRKGDLNIKGAFLHMAADAGLAAGVVVAGFLILKTGFAWIDPVVSLVIVVVIAVGTWGLLRDSVNLSLHAAPSGLDPARINQFLRKQRGVKEIHDLHVWPLSTTETALTVHLLVPDGYPGDQFSVDIAARLKELFEIDHATIQIETDPNVNCHLQSGQTV